MRVGISAKYSPHQVVVQVHQTDVHPAVVF